MGRAAITNLSGRGARLVFVAAIACGTLVASEGPSAAKRTAAIAALTDDGEPNVQSAAAIAIDAKTGELLYAKNPDAVRAIASTGKIFVAMAARRKHIDLNALTEISAIDAKFAVGGSRTRLQVGHKFRNQDLLRAMLIASDNRAPTAIARAVGLSLNNSLKNSTCWPRTWVSKRQNSRIPAGSTAIPVRPAKWPKPWPKP